MVFVWNRGGLCSIDGLKGAVAVGRNCLMKFGIKGVSMMAARNWIWVLQLGKFNCSKFTKFQVRIIKIKPLTYKINIRVIRGLKKSREWIG